MEVREKKVKSILTKSPVHDGYTANPYAGCEHNGFHTGSRNSFLPVLRAEAGNAEDREGGMIHAYLKEPTEIPIRSTQENKKHESEFLYYSYELRKSNQHHKKQ